MKNSISSSFKAKHLTLLLPCGPHPNRLLFKETIKLGLNSPQKPSKFGHKRDPHRPAPMRLPSTLVPHTTTRILKWASQHSLLSCVIGAQRMGALLVSAQALTSMQPCDFHKAPWRSQSAMSKCHGALRDFFFLCS